jgi:hypothetical protein
MYWIAGTPAGNYSLVYQICEILNPANCDTATVSVTVTTITDAVADAGTPINGFTGGTAFTNVLANDTLNNALWWLGQVNTTFVSATNAGITLSGTNQLVAALHLLETTLWYTKSWQNTKSTNCDTIPLCDCYYCYY